MCRDDDAPERPADRRPRVLVADDDPASCRFLADGLRRLGTEVTACLCGEQALQRARTEHYDLLLLDCRMPRAGALSILSALRNEPKAACHASMAVASSAEDNDAESAPLFDAGFSSVLHKPCSLAELQQLLTLIPLRWHPTGVLDDGSGLRSSGDQSTLNALRELMREELVALDAQLESLSHDPAELAERMHRLRASCGFCGAETLSHAAAGLQHEARQHVPPAASIARFRAVLQATLRSLETSG